MLKKVRPGEPIIIPASTYNAFIDVANWFALTRPDTAGSGPPNRAAGSPVVVAIRNDSGAAIDRFDVLGISGPLFSPTDAYDQFSEVVRLTGVTPTAAHVGAFAITLEPLRAGKIGRAVIEGVSVARVFMADNADTYADIRVGETGTLLSGGGGSVRLLSVQDAGDRDDPDIAVCLVRLGAGAEAFRLVIESVDGTGAPWEYTAKRVDIGTGGGLGAAYPLHNYYESRAVRADLVQNSAGPFEVGDIVDGWWEPWQDPPRFACDSIYETDMRPGCEE